MIEGKTMIIETHLRVNALIEIKKFKLYFLRHPVTLEIRYIGQTCRSLKDRWKEHILYDVRTNYKSNWVKSLKNQGLFPILELISCFDTKEESDKEEIRLIKEYRELCYRLTNAGNGGKSNAGCKRSDEHRLKLSMAMKGKPGWMKGIPMPEETKRKLSIAKKGKKLKSYKKKSLSQEHKNNIGKSISGEKNGFYGRKHKQKSLDVMISKLKTPENIKKSMASLALITPEHREKRRLKVIGRKHTEEVKARIAESVRRTKALKKQQLSNSSDHIKKIA